MVMEQYYMYAVTTCYSTPNGGRSCTTTYHYIYNDIIVVNIAKQRNGPLGTIYLTFLGASNRFETAALEAYPEAIDR